MGQRQRAWAARPREKLLDELGRTCAWCGRTEAEVKLTFDCIVPAADAAGHHRRYDWSWRMSFYRAQLAADNLQVLCDECNGRKGAAVIRFIPERLNWAHLGGFAPFRSGRISNLPGL